MAETPETLLSRVSDLLSMTDPDTFIAEENPTDLMHALDNAQLDLHLHHTAKLLTDTKQFSLVDNLQLLPAAPNTPSPQKKSPRKIGKKSARRKQLPMDTWNMTRSPKKVTHPYLRLFKLVGGNEERNNCWGGKKHRSKRTTSVNSINTAGAPKSRTNSVPRTIPQRKGRTLRLSTTERLDRQNESILRRFVHMLLKSRSIYGKNPETLRDLFQTVDKDCNGTIELHEFESALNRLGLGLTRNEIVSLATAIDDNGDGMIQYQELITAISKIFRQDARRHLDQATHHSTIASRYTYENRNADDDTNNSKSETLVFKFVDILLNERTSLVQFVEKLRRAFLEADQKRQGTVACKTFVCVVRTSGIAMTRDSDIAKIALGLQNETEGGEILYHEFLDGVSRRLRKRIRREKIKQENVSRMLNFSDDELIFFRKISTRISEIVQASEMPSDVISKVEEFMDPKIDEPRMGVDQFFAMLSNIGVTLSSATLLTLYTVLHFDKRNTVHAGSRRKLELNDDKRVARMHAINEAKIISKFKVMHKMHVKQQYAAQVGQVKARRVDKFRLQVMNSVIERLNDGGAIETRFQAALDKIRAVLRMSSNEPYDVMQIFTIFDTDGDGEVSREEFMAAVDLLGCDLTEDEAVSTLFFSFYKTSQIFQPVTTDFVFFHSM